MRVSHSLVVAALHLVTTSCGSDNPTRQPDSATGDTGAPHDDGSAYPPGDITVLPDQPCPGTSGGTCKTLTVSCRKLPSAAAVPDATAVVKVLRPAGAPIGTVVMSTGNDAEGHWGRTLYEGGTGAPVVADLGNKGYVTAQIVWRTDGVNVGPGGMKLLACRYATVAKWIFDGTGLLPKADPGIHTPGTPFGATGNSGGGGVIALSMSFHGLGQLVDKIVLTSTPILFDLVHSCVGGVPVNATCGRTPATDAYEDDLNVSARKSLDRSYGWVDANPTALTHCQNHDAAFTDTFRADGIAGNAEARTWFPHTDIVQILGADDGSSAKTIATSWFAALEPANGRTRETQCVTAPHTLTTTPEGRAAIMAQFTPATFAVRH